VGVERRDYLIFVLFELMLHSPREWVERIIVACKTVFGKIQNYNDKELFHD